MNAAEPEPWKEKETPSAKGSGLESLNTSTEKEVDLTQRIVAQVEFYFSDGHIQHDAFLLKHVRRNRDGYVSLKLVASLRKVKSVTKNWELVRDALRSSSSRLEVNAEGTKVRRREPLPEQDQTAYSRTIICFPLAEHVTVKDMAKVFSRCGPISMLGVLRPGGSMPPCSRRFVQAHREVYGCVAAVIEYEHHEAASLAVREASPLMHITLLAAAGSTGSRGNGGGGRQ